LYAARRVSAPARLGLYAARMPFKLQEWINESQEELIMPKDTLN